jgi:hypothetical protein
MDKLKVVPFDVFHDFYQKLNVPSKYDEQFLYELFSNLIESYNSTTFENVDTTLFKNINTIQLFLYLISEYDFFACKLTTDGILELNNNENILSMISSMALDKYITNEKVNLNEVLYVSKYSSNISTLMLYLNFMIKVMNQYSKNSPSLTLLSDILLKCVKITKCSLDLLIDGFETEAFSVWRTLHETECVLRLLVTYKEPIIKEYLIHMNYSLIYRRGLDDKDQLDAVFAEIKEKLRKHGLKSKDMKKFIEYGYLFAIPEIELDKDFKLNFRDGVEKLAGLSEYSKLYEYSSEIAHSSPLMIYSNEKKLSHLTLSALYEVFFRIETIFTNNYLNRINEDSVKAAYLQMRSLYYSQIVELYKRETSLNKNN